MPRIPFPNVPKLPGVPLIPRALNVPPLGRFVLGTLQGLLWQVLQRSTEWGIYDTAGRPLGGPESLTATLSINALTYGKQTRVSDFPIEQGGFAAYNKVEMPASPVVRLCLGGTESDRTAFLLALDAACLSLELFTVLTPEKVYIGYTIERYEYQRSNSSGANMLIVDVMLKEIRQVTSQYTQANKGGVVEPKEASATPTANNGKLQPKTPETSTINYVIKALPTVPR